MRIKELEEELARERSKNMRFDEEYTR